MFRKSVSPLSSGTKSKPSKKTARIALQAELPSGLLLGLLFDLDEGYNMLLRNIGPFANYNPQDHNLHSRRCENLKSNSLQ
jgi:hypothetical protein